MQLMLFVGRKKSIKWTNLICSFRRLRIIYWNVLSNDIFYKQMKKIILTLFLFGAVYSCFIGKGFGGGLRHSGKGCALFGKPKPAPAPICQPVQQPAPQPQPQPQPQPPQVCQQPPQFINPNQPSPVPTPPFYNPQPPIYNPGYPSQPAPPILPPPFFTQGYPSYPNYPQQPSYPNFPQIPNNQYQPQRNGDYILTFDWAPRTNGINKLASSKGVVKIGNQIVADLSADCGNQRIRRAELNINLENGENSITFEGAGDSDSYGVTVSNVVIRRRDSNQNLLVNGDFSSPCLAPGTWQLIRNGIKGWSVDVAEVGDCKIYNNDWKGGQCIELDSTGNQCYTQRFNVDRC